MSIWGEIKKAINSDLETPLNVLIENGIIGGYKLFTASGNFTVPKGVKKILVTAIGSGGGGGGSGSAYTYSAENSSGYYIPRGATGGGGGSGEFKIDEPFAVTPGAVIPITINPGGTGGAGATATENANGVIGGAGGSVIVGNLLTVKGGSGGGGATYVRVNSGTGDNVSGSRGVGGTGGVAGANGASSDWKANNANFNNVAGGAGGVASEIFGGAYGKGGTGGTSVIANVTRTWFGGNSGTSGQSGAVLITWGQFDHETVY